MVKIYSKEIKNKLWDEDGTPSQHYKKIIQTVENNISLKYPKTWKSLETIFGLLEAKKPVQHLLIGLIQSGKSLAASILIWTIHYKYHMYVVFITKNLGSIRDDIMYKLKHGTVNSIVKESLVSCLVDESEMQEFVPRLKEMQDLKQNCNIERGVIPILIMHYKNYPHLINFAKNVKDKPFQKNPIVFIVDEAHEMYVDQEKFCEKRGLTHTNNFSIIHWLKQQVYSGQTPINFLIEITATPYRQYLDTHLYPGKDQITLLENDPPKEGLTYFGYSWKGELEQVEVKSHRRDEDVVQDALTRDRENGFCPFILITKYQTNQQQFECLNNIKNKFGDDVYVKTFHSCKSCPPECRKTNCKRLEQFFSGIPEEIQRDQGVVVLIGKERLDTGITVKSTSDKVLSWLPGVTDQLVASFVKGSSHMEGRMQLMRLFGWFPPGHTSTLWVSPGQIDLHKTEMIDVHRHLIENYNGRPSKNLAIPKQIRHICRDSLYQLGENRGSTIIEYLDQQPDVDDCYIVSTTVTPISTLLKVDDQFYNRTLRSFHKKIREQNELKKQLGLEKGSHTGLRIAYDNKRFDEIIRGSVHPEANPLKGSPDSCQGWVNCFIWGEDRVETPLHQSYVVAFNTQYADKRKTLKTVEEGRPLVFKVANDKWIQATLNQELDNGKTHIQHKFYDMIDGELDKQHFKVLGKIDQLWQEASSKGVMTGWLLFLKTRKELGRPGGGSVKLASIEWRNNQNIKLSFDRIAKDKDIGISQKLKKGEGVYTDLIINEIIEDVTDEIIEDLLEIDEEEIFDQLLDEENVGDDEIIDDEEITEDGIIDDEEEIID